MTKHELKTVVLWLALLAVMITAVGYAVVSGAKAESLEQTIAANEKEIKKLNVDLKGHKSLMLERDIELLDKDSTIKSLVAQNEALMWRLPGGSQDE